MCVLCFFLLKDRNTGTNLNLVFEEFLEKMALIKIRAGENFKEHRHVIIVFTDGISSLLINSAVNNKKCSLTSCYHNVVVWFFFLALIISKNIVFLKKKRFCHCFSQQGLITWAVHQHPL